MELKVLENVQKLSWNFEDVKKELTSQIEKYTNLVVSETNLAEMEKTQKDIAGLRIRLQKFRLEVKKDFEKPFEEFEQQIKVLASLIESTEKPIKDQIQKYEDKRREAKRTECQDLIIAVAAKIGLEEKYRDQIVIDEKWINRGSKIKAIKEDIQMKVVYFLDQQKADKEAETFRQQKIEMAQFMIESLSKDLATPLTFADVENKIEYLNIGELRTYIENQVAARKEREERAAQQALERAERERIAEIARREKIKQEELQRAERERVAEELKEQKRLEAEQQRIALEAEVTKLREEDSHKAHIEMLAKINEPPAPVEVKPTDKLYNAQFVLYGVNTDQIEKVGAFINSLMCEFKHAVKEA